MTLPLLWYDYKVAIPRVCALSRRAGHQGLSRCCKEAGVAAHGYAAKGLNAITGRQGCAIHQSNAVYVPLMGLWGYHARGQLITFYGKL